MKLKSLLILVWCFCFSESFAQINITPNIMGNNIQSIEDLWKVTIFNNSGQSINGYLEISIQEGSSQLLLLKSPIYMLSAGMNIPNNSLISVTPIKYGNNASSGYIRETGKLPYTKLTLCYRFFGSLENNLLATSCQELAIEPLFPPELLQPSDKSTSCMPIMMWKPPYPVSGDLTYRIKMCEVKKGQSPIQALRTNPPMFDMVQINNTTLNYPQGARPLVKGSKYAWQVNVSTSRFDLGQTDIWSFIYDCDKSEIVDEETCFRFAQYGISGSNFIVKDQLKFAYNNLIGEVILNYTIRNMDEKKLQSLPVIKLENGLNIMNLSVKELDIPYDIPQLLVITDLNLNQYYVEFIREK